MFAVSVEMVNAVGSVVCSSDDVTTCSCTRVPTAPGLGMLPTDNPQKEQVGRALSLAKKSTASIGKFTEALPKEKPTKNQGKKRKVFFSKCKFKSKNVNKYVHIFWLSTFWLHDTCYMGTCVGFVIDFVFNWLQDFIVNYVWITVILVWIKLCVDFNYSRSILSV